MKGLSSFLVETLLGLVGLIVVLFIIHAVLYPKEKPPQRPPISPTSTPIRVIDTPEVEPPPDEPPPRLPISPTPTPIRVINTPTPTPKKVEVSDLKLSFQTSKTTYNVGDKVFVYVQSTQNCYLKIFGISTEGKFYQLIPSQWSSIRLLKGNVSYQIPRAKDLHNWVTEGPQGTDSMFAVCTLRDVNILPNHIRKGDRIGVQNFEQMLTRNLEKLPRQEWTISSAEYFVKDIEERRTNTTISPSNLRLSFQTNKTTYNVGDKVVVHVQANKNCYLKIFDISTEGMFYQLIPSQWSSIRLLKGNVSYQIPGAKDKYDWTIGEGPQGTESMFAVCTLREVNIIPNHINEGDRFGVQEFEQMLTRNLEKLPRQEWTISSVQFSVK